MTYHSAFDRRIDNTPDDWRGPLTEVVDTADAIRLALRDWEVDSPELLLGLTKLALERYDASRKESCPHCHAWLTPDNPEPKGKGQGCLQCIDKL